MGATITRSAPDWRRCLLVAHDDAPRRDLGAREFLRVGLGEFARAKASNQVGVDAHPPEAGTLFHHDGVLFEISHVFLWNSRLARGQSSKRHPERRSRSDTRS